jgi:uncharacterized protein
MTGTTFRKTGTLLLTVLALFLAAIAAAQSAPDFPTLTGRVVDQADLLDAAAEAALTDRLAALEERTTDQFVVVTLPGLQGYTIEDYGVALGRHWAIGQKDKNNGVLLIVAPNERKVRIEVGYGLEGTLTDALTRTIIETSILPHFRSGDMPAGIEAGADDIIKVLTGNAEEISQRLVSRDSSGDDIFPFIIFTLMVFMVILIIYLHFKGGGTWTSGSGSSRSSGSSWSSSSGGFSGGGGSFGGGGSSGSW